MVDWDCCTPRSGETTLVYCKPMKALLAVGCFILFSSSSSDKQEQVGCIIGVSDDEEIEINVFGVLPKLSTTPIVGLNQIQQSPQCIWVSTECIQNIAFVFNKKDFEDNLCFVARGMKNLYLLCDSRLDGSDLPEDQFRPFPSSYDHFKARLPDCYSSRIWHSLDLLRRELSRLLGRYSEKQGCFASAKSKVTISAETWHYILQFVGSYMSSPPRSYTSKRCRRVLETGLYLRSLRQVHESEMIRFATESELQILRELLGDLTGLDVRKRRPAMADPQRLRINDAINVIVGSESAHEQFDYRTSDDGLDLAFNGLNELSISVRYRLYIYRTSLNGEPHDCPSETLKNIIQRRLLICSNGDRSEGNEENTDPADTVEVNSEFEKDGHLYRVISILPNRSRLVGRCLYPRSNHGEEKEFSVREVSSLITDRMR